MSVACKNQSHKAAIKINILWVFGASLPHGKNKDCHGI